jgi:MYXO-CTERM domain-containing protein
MRAGSPTVLWQWRPAPVRVDRVVALALLAAIELQIWVGGTAEGARPVAAVTALGLALAVAIRRRRPLVAVGLTAGVGIGQDVLGAPFAGSAPVALVAVVLVVYAAASLSPGRPARVALGLGLVSACAGLATGRERTGEAVLGALLFVVAPWLTGRVVRGRRAAEVAERSRAERLDADRERHSEAAAAAERLRIAAELHDVIAHSISVMVILAGAARAVMEIEPGRSIDSLRLAGRAGVDALAETGRLCGLLTESTGDPRPSGPGLADLGELLGRARAAGLTVELLREDGPPLPPPVDRCAYRIVQEALTNAIRHSGAGRVEVRVGRGAGEVEVEVQDDGRGPAPGPGGSSGHGLAGMRERAGRLGGEVQSGAAPGGGFRVHARLPLGVGPADQPALTPARRPALAGPRLVGVAVDVLLAVWLLLECLLQGTHSRVIGAVAALAFAAAIGVRRRRPDLALVLAAAVLSLQALLGGGLGRGSGAPVLIGLALLSYSTGELRPRRRGLVATALAALACVGFVAASGPGPGADVAAALFVALVVLAAPWWAGTLVAGHRRRAVAFGEQAARSAGAAERGAREAIALQRRRIAGELSGVVTPTLEEMVGLAAEAGVLVDEDRAAAQEAILGLERRGREALAELRRLLGVLRRDEGRPERRPQPGLDQIGPLLAASAARGLRCELAEEGERAVLAPGLDLVAYRALEGGISIAARRGTRATVAIRWGEELLELEVEGDGPDPDPGRELISLRRRLALYGGTLEEPAGAAGRFTMRARLPLAGSGGR